jgi:hypothetical protein
MRRLSFAFRVTGECIQAKLLTENKRICLNLSVPRYELDLLVSSTVVLVFCQLRDCCLVSNLFSGLVPTCEASR